MVSCDNSCDRHELQLHPLIYIGLFNCVQCAINGVVPLASSEIYPALLRPTIDVEGQLCCMVDLGLR